MASRSSLDAIPRRVARLESSEPFDPEFYRSNYPDLAHLSQRALRRHYILYGRKEGRLGSATNLETRADTDAKLPPDFDAKTYLQLNADLRASGLSDAEAILHYLSRGIQERRPYRGFNPSVYRELYFGDEHISDDSLERHYMEIGRLQGRIGSAAELLASEDCAGASWADSIRLHEFALLNWSWAGKVARYLDAVRLMMREGISRLAPLSFELQFDVKYYRETHSAFSDLSDEALYRRWLWEERACTPASQAQHLKRLGLTLEVYPSGFRWRDYARTQQRLNNRWAALDHLVREGAPAHVVPPVERSKGAVFLVALSQTLAYKDDKGAIRLLDTARELPGFSPSALQWLGDSHYRLEHWEEAYQCYAKVARSSEAVVWSVCNGARAALRLGQPKRALELLTLGQAAFAGEQAWRGAVHDAIQAEFDKSWAEAKQLYFWGERRQADAIMSEAAMRSGERWSAFDALGVPLPEHPDGRVVVLANTDLTQCTHYRVNQKADLFEVLERPYAIYAQADVDKFITALAGASAAIFYRLAATPQNVRAIQAARAMGIPTYYDIDDLIFDPVAYPEPRETYGEGVNDELYAMLQMGVPLFRTAMALCDHGIASTTALARHMSRVVRSGTVHVLPNGLDHTNEIYLDHPPTRCRRDGEFVIFYGSGTKAHNSDFLDLAGQALKTVMSNHSHVRLMVVGYLDLDESFDELRDRITYMDWIADVASYWSILAEADLSIAVLSAHTTTDAKSEIKWIEAAALGVPSIVSATDRYREVLEDGVDVLMASSVEEWTIALERMITDPVLRLRLTSKAGDKLRRHYALQQNALTLGALLPETPVRVSRPARKTRVLLSNVFFPPQTYGGATRVARDNLDYFLAHATEDFEFAVVTSDLDAGVPYRLRVEDYQGTTVFRISTPRELNMDWRYENPEIRRIFTEILDIWSPDLVHFHCVQRLTGSVVDVCRERGTPYIVTVHDAWWVSDYQFLSDQKDRLRTPGEAWPLDPPPSISVGASLARRRYLQSLLQDATEILGVSESFTRLYQGCGFERAVCVANGVSPMPKVARRRSPSGRVRLAQIGSQTYFKGYHHIQAALKQSRFSNLELTVVDHTRFGGPVETALWGATPVYFVGKTKQESMHEFYADIDVLLAPSLWPESFGLVTREALNAGLWVLASDRGAIGEDVTPGRNGWVVDVSTPAGVIDALAEINLDAKRYLASPPPPEPPLRTSDDQARDLLDVYRDVLSRPQPSPKHLPLSPAPYKPTWSLEARAKAQYERASFKP